MLAIRPQQMQKFSEAALKRFEDTMVVHLKNFFPDFSETSDEPKVRELIRYGIKRSGSYKIAAEKDVSRYIDLMVSLGPDFDTDKQLSWASEILRTNNSPEMRISILLKTAENHLRKS
jgi:hypothetical protein